VSENYFCNYTQLHITELLYRHQEAYLSMHNNSNNNNNNNENKIITN